MTTTIDATVVDGALQLDEPLALPDQSRVRVTVAEQPLPHDREVARRLEVLKKFRVWSDAHPLFSDGECLTRDQLHESTLLSEAALAADWNRPEEDAAWAR